MVKALVKRVLPEPLFTPARHIYRRLKNAVSPAAAPVDPDLPSCEEFSQRHFADAPVDLANFGHFVGRKFPNAGPLAWLDRPDAK